MKPQEKNKSEIEVTIGVSSDATVITVTTRDVQTGVEKEVTLGGSEAPFFQHAKEADKLSGLAKKESKELMPI